MEIINPNMLPGSVAPMCQDTLAPPHTGGEGGTCTVKGCPVLNPWCPLKT